MKPTFVLLFFVALIALAAIAVLKKKRAPARKATGEVTAKQPLTEREQAMYFRLVASLPQHIVLAQVAFSALLDTKDRPTRSSFDRKVADFLVCSKAFVPIAVVELDDATHRGKGAKDKARDALLASAGLRTLRFKNVPDADEVKRAFL